MVFKEKDFVQSKMTPEEQAVVKDRLREVAEILYRRAKKSGGDRLK